MQSAAYASPTIHPNRTTILPKGPPTEVVPGQVGSADMSLRSPHHVPSSLSLGTSAPIGQATPFDPSLMRATQAGGSPTGATAAGVMPPRPEAAFNSAVIPGSVTGPMGAPGTG